MPTLSLPWCVQMHATQEKLWLWYTYLGTLLGRAPTKVRPTARRIRREATQFHAGPRVAAQAVDDDLDDDPSPGGDVGRDAAASSSAPSASSSAPRTTSTFLREPHAPGAGRARRAGRGCRATTGWQWRPCGSIGAAPRRVALERWPAAAAGRPARAGRARNSTNAYI